jgi:hypothetical protein
VSTRNEQLASAVEQQSRETIEFLRGLSDADMNEPCADPSGATVGAVVAHLGEGYDQVLGWIESVAGETTAPIGTVGHRHEPHAHDTAERIELLRLGGEDWAALLRRVDDERLDRVPPAAENITDGTRTLAEIMQSMLEHQSTHVEYVRQAVAGRSVDAR